MSAWNSKIKRVCSGYLQQLFRSSVRAFSRALPVERFCLSPLVLYSSYCLPACLSVYLSIYQSINLSIYLSIYLCVCLSVSVCLCPSVCVYTFLTYVPTYLPTVPTKPPAIYLSGYNCYRPMSRRNVTSRHVTSSHATPLYSCYLGLLHLATFPVLFLAAFSLSFALYVLTSRTVYNCL